MLNVEFPMRDFLLLSLCLLLAIPAAPRRQSLKLKTGKRVVQRASTLEADSVALDSIAPLILFSGYDKPAAGNYETFHVTNNSPRHINSLTVTFTYTDLDGRMLHRRQEPINVAIPPGETRQVRLKSFDLQHSYYYHRSSPPARRSATPYRVSLTLTSLRFPK